MGTCHHAAGGRPARRKANYRRGLASGSMGDCFPENAWWRGRKEYTETYIKMRLQNKVIVVTGSTTGIGKAIACRCVAEGAEVVIHGLEESLGQDVVKQLGERAVLHIED